MGNSLGRLCILGFPAFLFWSTCAWAGVNPFEPAETPISRERPPVPETPEPTKGEALLKPESAPLEKPESLFEFFSKRTQLGWGLRQDYNDNITLEDNRRREDYINSIKGYILFTDPRAVSTVWR